MKKIVLIFLFCICSVASAQEVEIELSSLPHTEEVRALTEELLQEPPVLQERGFFSWLFGLFGGSSSDSSAMDTLIEWSLGLRGRLNSTVFGQEHAVNATADSIARFVAGINSPEKPIATLLYVGPTGVGKTALAKALSEEMYSTSSTMLRLDMGEYSSHADVTKIIGQSVGWVGSESGGALINHLEQYPSSVILLDEMEKAAPEVRKLFLGIFDEGRVTSGMMKTYDCTQCVFIVTTNLGGPEAAHLMMEGLENHEALECIEPIIISELSPELYNRLDPILFNSINPESLKKIVLSELNKVSDRIFINRKVSVIWDQSVVNYLVENGYSVELGARPVKRLIENELVTGVAYTILQGKANPGETLVISIANGQFLGMTY